MAGEFVFNIVKGKVRYYTELPAANDALIVVLLKSTGLEADGTLKDYDDLAALLAGTSDEADFTNYARIVVNSGIIATVDDTGDVVNIDASDLLWSNAGNSGTAAGSGAGNNILGKLLWCYDPDTTTGTDSSVVPLLAQGFSASTDGNDLEGRLATLGFFQAKDGP